MLARMHDGRSRGGRVVCEIEEATRWQDATVTLRRYQSTRVDGGGRVVCEGKSKTRRSGGNTNRPWR
jgi:hypothetical protein